MKITDWACGAGTRAWHSCLPRRDSSRRLLDFRAFSEEALGLVRWYKPVSSSE
jgi:hypothetical protein